MSRIFAALPSCLLFFRQVLLICLLLCSMVCRAAGADEGRLAELELPAGAAANPALSFNGRYLAFELAPQENGVPGAKGIYTYDFDAGNVHSWLQTVGWDSVGPSVSDKGQVLFATRASLISMDLNGFQDLYMYDPASRETNLITKAFDGSSADGPTLGGALDAAGRYAALESGANLTEFVDLNAGVLRYDALDQSTVNGIRLLQPLGANVHISADGRLVVFNSSTPISVADAQELQDVYLKDPGVFNELISVNLEGRAGNGHSYSPVLSADGRAVAFVSRASDLVEQAQRQLSSIYLRDREARSTVLVSATESGTQADGSSDWPHVSSDGGYVAFVSVATDLAAGVDNQIDNVYLFSRKTGRVRLISRGIDGRGANALCGSPQVFSQKVDGRDDVLVVFASAASNLTAGGASVGGAGIYFYRNRLRGPAPRVIDDAPEASFLTQSNGKFSLAVQLDEFEGIERQWEQKLQKKAQRLKRSGLLGAKALKLKQRYEVQLKSLGAAAAGRRSKIRRSKNAKLVFKNVKSGRYAVRYRIQIIYKRAVLGKSGWSPAAEVRAEMGGGL